MLRILLRFAVCCLLLDAYSSTRANAQSAPRYEKRWVWLSCNLQVNEEVDRVSALMERAAKAGYNGVVLTDYKMNFLQRVPDWYFKNAKKVIDAAKKSKIEIIPGVFSVGYSNGLLSNDVNLAEGVEVQNAPYRIKSGKGVLLSDPKAKLANGGLEETKGNTFLGFGYQDNPGQTTHADHSIVHGGRTSCRMENFNDKPVCRLIQKATVRPHACYRASCWVKSKDFQNAGDFRLLALAGEGGRSLTFQENVLEPTQDWKQVEVVFNSLDQTSVNLYAGTWGGKSGSLWIDDLALEELSFVNILRREGCPLKITSKDEKTVYKEGVDFEPLVDPKLGMTPYQGEYRFDHIGPELRIKKGSRIKEGSTVLVSWYHPVLTHGSYAACCLSEPKVYDLLQEQAKHQRFVPSQDVLHAARRVARGKLVPSVPTSGQDSRRASC